MGGHGSETTYDASLLAALPRTLFYGSVLAGVHAALAYMWFDDAVGAAALVAAIVFLTVLGGTVAMAVYGYRRRFWEFGPDAVTERRWALRPVEHSLAYEDIEDITLTQSPAQSVFDAATLRLNHVESDTVGDEEDMRIRFVGEPRAVYSDLLSRCAEYHDPVAREEVADHFGTHSVENASVFSGDRAATATGGTYLMPYAVVEPRTRALVRALSVRSLVMATVLMAPAMYVLVVGLWFTQVRAVGAWLALFVGYFGYGIWKHGRVTHELYGEYLKEIRGDEITTVGYDDVAAVEHSDGRGNVGTVIARDNDGDTVAEMTNVADAASLADGLAEIADADRT